MSHNPFKHSSVPPEQYRATQCAYCGNDADDQMWLNGLRICNDCHTAIYVRNSSQCAGPMPNLCSSARRDQR
jgi:hypothetical protein